MIWLNANNDTGDSGTWTLMMTGGQVGHKWIFDGGFMMSFALGGWTNISSSWAATVDGVSGSGSAPFLGGFLPTVDFDLGFAF